MIKINKYLRNKINIFTNYNINYFNSIFFDNYIRGFY